MKSSSVFTKTGQRILALFFDHPTAELFEREVREKVKASAGAVNASVDKLARDRYLLMERSGRMKFCRLNREDPRVKHMKIAHTLSKPVIRKLEQVKTPCTRVFLYGSAARGEDDEGSDIDVLVVGAATMAALRKAVPDRTVKFSLFTAREWADMRRKDPAFYERVEKDRKEL